MRQYYKPWGEIRPGPNNSLPTDYTYTGQKWDSSLKLMFYGARWLDPLLARFVQPDSIIPDPTNPADFDRYSYVRNNPVKYIDPDGHSPCGNGTLNCNNPHNTDSNPANPGQSNGSSDNGDAPQNPPFDNSLGGNNDANQNGLSNQQNSTNGTKPQQQSPAAGSINEPPPIEKRAATVIFMLPFIVLVDTVFDKLNGDHPRQF